MPDRQVQVSQPCEITADDLHDAYVLCRLRRLGIGYLKAISTPSIAVALRAIATKRKKQQQQLEIPA